MYNTQRDVFISELQTYAEKDPNVIMISVDMGAPSLDSWREKLPNQFFAGGISEQNSINFAAGLSAEGKKVYVYLMSCWAARCYEQLRYSCSMAKNPITFLGNGVGLGYAPAGPAHCPTEDIGYLRTINDIEVISPANINIIKDLVALTYNKPALRALRLERTTAKEVEPFYTGDNSVILSTGAAEVYFRNEKKRVITILSSGFMLGRALQVANKLVGQASVRVVDLFRIKPINWVALYPVCRDSHYLVSLEEQTLDGGFGSAIAECLVDYGVTTPFLRLGLPPRYIFENGNRNQLLDGVGLSADSICASIETFVSKR